MFQARSRPPRFSQRGSPLLALLVANAVLACGPWMVRLAKEQSHVGPAASAFWRLALAFPILLAASRLAGERLPPNGRPLVALAGLSGVFFAVDLACWHAGILQTRLANATLLGNTTALLFPVWGFFAMRRLPGRKQAAALLLAAAGAALLLGRSFEISAANLRGDLLCLTTGISYTVYLIIVERVRGGLGPLTTLVAATAVSALLLLLLVLAAGDRLLPDDWTPLVALSIGSQVIGQGLLLLAVGRASPLAIGLMLLIQPFVSGVIGWVFYGERLTAVDGIGAAAIGLAILLVRDSSRRLRADDISLSS